MGHKIHCGDALEVLRTLPDQSINCCVTSPPYWGLRDYGMDRQFGSEPTPEDYVERMVEVFTQVRRVLRADGVAWINLGDSYADDTKWGGSTGGKHAAALHGASSIGRRKTTTGLKSKDLIGIPWRVALALQADGWYLRSDIIWAKPNPMPESVTDRPTRAHEYLFLLSKSERYHYDADAIKEPASQANRNGFRGENDGPSHYVNQPEAPSNSARFGKPDKQRGHGRRHAGFNDRWDAMEKAEQCSGMRNKRSVWTIATHPFADAHFATFPQEIPRLCILAGCPEGGTVLDPFAGSGTTILVAKKLNREGIGIELNPEYVRMAQERIDIGPLFEEPVIAPEYPVNDLLFQEPA